MSSQKHKASKTSKASYAMPQVQQEKPKSQNIFQVIGNLPSNQPKQTFAQKASSNQSQ